mmetsp:Transcript_14476/g.31471  ORF Transcript_14476/g.31471 Transcript_14476/m.31471 type:complete len:250 (-) Transcript_14476:136-885(-)
MRAAPCSPRESSLDRCLKTAPHRQPAGKSGLRPERQGLRPPVGDLILAERVPPRCALSGEDEEEEEDRGAKACQAQTCRRTRCGQELELAGQAEVLQLLVLQDNVEHLVRGIIVVTAVPQQDVALLDEVVVVVQALLRPLLQEDVVVHLPVHPLLVAILLIAVGELNPGMVGGRSVLLVLVLLDAHALARTPQFDQLFIVGPQLPNVAPSLVAFEQNQLLLLSVVVDAVSTLLDVVLGVVVLVPESRSR